ncbi:MAG: dTDP-4-dehydrorhamnose reductase [Desulfuromonadales bacterium]|nr:dTDP-4-dehydrorhamnose reductase [Desulfuromonadales bacterium]
MILVVGCNGMLGSDLMALLGDRARGVDAQDMDITSLESVERVLTALRPSVLINCAAYTDVDGCESNQGKAMQVNGEAVSHLAMVTRTIGAKLVQISTDYVFNGSKRTPYIESDRTSTLSIYGESKLRGERNAALNPDFLVVRTQWLYGLHGNNFIETMLRLAGEKDQVSVVDDQTGSPTWTIDLSRAIMALLDKGCRGVYHAANSGFCTWNEFARAIFEESGLNVRVNAMTTRELNRPANRPLNSILGCDKLEQATGVRLQPWREALGEYLKLRNTINRG